MTGELKKMKIDAHQKVDYSDSPVDTFTVMFNPEKYTRKFEINYEKGQGAGDTGSKQIFKGIKPEDYSFEILIDGTGTAAKKVEVNDTIKHFIKVTGKNDGKIHRPRYLKIVWGTLCIKCVLKSADISYVLFKPDGTPIRARINFTVTGYIDDELRVAKTGNTSPDLTHSRLVKQGDHLPYLTNEIYDSPVYYLQVAQANGLKNFRRLRAGQQLFFPPIKNKKG